jgi:formylglycine-generating enzyme required for sulfatase activity
VLFEKGFWMFDTPCTQKLWEAVMKENSSRFRSPNRPVELVSWEECNAFVTELNQRYGGPVLALPSEAQWEYACRAGTVEATYAGNLEIVGMNHAPILDKIAWYGGNCGVDFDLDDGHDMTGWVEKQYKAPKQGGTHPVAKKLPNPWGLYDMLGNVWEWCADAWSAPPVDLAAPDRFANDGAVRVIRGGSWYSLAHRVRAASRDRYPPADRYDYLGLRCAEFREGREFRSGLERAGSGSVPGREQGSELRPASRRHTARSRRSRKK